MFLGTTFFGGRHIFMPPAAHISWESTSLSDGTYSRLFLNKDPELTYDNVKDDWTYDTLLNAPYTKDLEAGNIGFSLNNTDTMIIRKRKKGTLHWIPIYQIPVHEASDFQFTKQYPYAPNNEEAEYMLLSCINGIENSYTVTDCRSEFDGFYIADQDAVYGTCFNLDPADTTRNTQTGVLELLNSRYPYVFSNSKSSYTTGTLSGCFLKQDARSGNADPEGGTRYRDAFLSFLTNQKPKIVKLQDGRAFLIKVTGNPTDTEDEHPDMRRVSFDFTEIGDVSDPMTLYYNGLSDVTKEWW